MRLRLLRSVADRCGDERGQALVELALTIPLLLLFLFGIVDVGRAVNYWNNETNLANQAARIVAVNSIPTTGTCGAASSTPTASNVSTYITCQAGIDSKELGNGVSVCISSPGSGAVGTDVTVKVTETFNWLPFVKTAIGSPSSSISGTATMRIENATTAYTQTAPC